MDDRLAAVQAEAAGDDGDRVVGDGDDDELRVVEKRVRLGEGANAWHEAAKALAPPGIAGRDRADDPTRAIEGHAERGSHGSRADDSDDRRLARLGPDMGMGVRLGVVVGPARRAVMRVVAAGTARARLRVQPDPARLELVEHRGVVGRALVRVSLRLVAGLAPGSHPPTPQRRRRPSHPGRAGRSRYASTRRVYRPRSGA